MKNFEINPNQSNLFPHVRQSIIQMLQNNWYKICKIISETEFESKSESILNLKIKSKSPKNV